MGSWSPPAFDPFGECTCTPRHSPRLMVTETHHILPLSWGGTDTAPNKARICPNTHYGTHALLNEYVGDVSGDKPSGAELHEGPERCRIRHSAVFSVRSKGVLYV